MVVEMPMVLADIYPGGSLKGALFSILWFLLMFMIGITAIFLFVKTVTDGLRDALHWGGQLIVTLYCVVSFGISLLMCKKIYGYNIQQVLVKHSGSCKPFPTGRFANGGYILCLRSQKKTFSPRISWQTDMQLLLEFAFTIIASLTFCQRLCQLFFRWHHWGQMAGNTWISGTWSIVKSYISCPRCSFHPRQRRLSSRTLSTTDYSYGGGDLCGWETNWEKYWFSPHQYED